MFPPPPGCAVHGEKGTEVLHSARARVPTPPATGSEGHLEPDGESGAQLSAELAHVSLYPVPGYPGSVSMESTTKHKAAGFTFLPASTEVFSRIRWL